MPKRKKESGNPGHDPPPSPAAAPIPDSIRENLTLREETDELLIQLASQEKAILICAIAPYRGARISPAHEVQASIGLHEEFAFEAMIDEIQSRRLVDKKGNNILG